MTETVIGLLLVLGVCLILLSRVPKLLAQLAELREEQELKKQEADHLALVVRKEKGEMGWWIHHLNYGNVSQEEFADVTLHHVMLKARTTQPYANSAQHRELSQRCFNLSREVNQGRLSNKQLEERYLEIEKWREGGYQIPLEQ